MNNEKWKNSHRFVYLHPKIGNGKNTEIKEERWNKWWWPSLQRASGRKVLTSPVGAEYHVCRGFGAARIVHIRGLVAAGYSPVKQR